MKKNILVALVALCMSLPLLAGVVDDFKASPKMSANNYQAYPEHNLPALTPAPAGYVPFYMNHYGRHGSRWLIDPKQYAICVNSLQAGDEAGVLSARGKQALAIFKEIQQASTKRLGELSDVGAEQHQHIAWRMYHNFPEIFGVKNVPIDAKSTIVIRCILSMQNEVDQLKALNPTAHVVTDASEHDMYYMNYRDSIASKLRKIAVDKYNSGLKEKYLHPEHMLSVLFTDVEWAKSHIDTKQLMQDMFDVVGNMQSHHQFDDYNLYDLFSLDDMVNTWKFNNARWYLYSAETPLTQNRVDYMEANLLRNMLESAQAAIATGTPAATLRFGHESVLLPLVCLMGLENFGYRTTNLDHLADHWQSYKIFPMACNVQWVFYSKKGSEQVLMKCLLNEHEVRLPKVIKPVKYPYYDWADVKTYYEKKLAEMPQVKLP